MFTHIHTPVALVMTVNYWKLYCMLSSFFIQHLPSILSMAYSVIVIICFHHYFKLQSVINKINTIIVCMYIFLIGESSFT